MHTILFYLKQYIGLPAIYFHELSHYYVHFILFLFGYNSSMPTIKITRWPYIKRGKDSDTYCGFSARCSSEYKYNVTEEDKKHKFFHGFLSPIAPLISYICLLDFTYDKELYVIFWYSIYYFEIFIPSTKDWDDIYDYIGRKLLLWH